MNKENLTYKIVDNIMSYLKYTLLTIIEEETEELPVFTNVLNIMSCMNKYTYSYTLSDIDDKLFDKLIEEVITVLH